MSRQYENKVTLMLCNKIVFTINRMIVVFCVDSKHEELFNDNKTTFSDTKYYLQKNKF